MGDRTLDVIVERTRCLCGIESVRNLIQELEKLSALYGGASESAGQLAMELKRLHSELVEGCIHWRERALEAKDGKEQRLFGAKRERCESVTTEFGELLKRLMPSDRPMEQRP
jgi:hypothetical protein